MFLEGHFVISHTPSEGGEYPSLKIIVQVLVVFDQVMGLTERLLLALVYLSRYSTSIKPLEI
jgi:hypothetical protein